MINSYASRISKLEQGYSIEWTSTTRIQIDNQETRNERTQITQTKNPKDLAGVVEAIFLMSLEHIERKPEYTGLPNEEIDLLERIRKAIVKRDQEIIYWTQQMEARSDLKG